MILQIVHIISGVECRGSFGSCPEIETQIDFDQVRHSGKWYEAQRDKIFTWEMAQECGTQEFKVNQNGGSDFYFRAWFPFVSYQGISGQISNCGADPSRETCQLKMKNGEKSYPWSILATDYDNWSVMYMCSEPLGKGFIYNQYLQINDRQGLGTKANLAPAHAAIKAILPDFDLSGWSMYNTS